MGEQTNGHTEWKNAWSQREENEERIINGCFDVVTRLPFADVENVCIFNCSDGPAACGILQGLIKYSQEFDVLLTDIHPYAINAASEYIQNLQSNNLLPKSVRVHSKIYDTIALLSDPPSHVRNFISYEPIAITLDLLERAYDMIQAKSSITIIGRSPQGPVSLLGIAAKHKQAIMYIESGIRTDSGNITAVMIRK